MPFGRGVVNPQASLSQAMIGSDNSRRETDLYSKVQGSPTRLFLVKKAPR